MYTRQQYSSIANMTQQAIIWIQSPAWCWQRSCSLVPEAATHRLLAQCQPARFATLIIPED